MCDYDIQTDFYIKGLSLIDVSSEDDRLINSPICDQINPHFSGSFDEQGKLEINKSRGNRRCNTRKSLTWDSSFFSSAAFLEPEESLEDDSIEPPSNNVKKEPETTDPRAVSSSNKLESTNKDKVMQKGAPKKANIAVKDPGKTIKQVSSRPQTSQSVGRSGVSTSSLHKGVSRVCPISTTQTRRVSFGCKDIKMENDAKIVTGRGTTMSKTHALGDSRNTVARPTSSISSLNMISNDSKIEAEGKSRAGHSLLSTLAKLNSSMSAARSYSEWSSESSSTSTEVTGSLPETENKVSNESTGGLNPISIKPSGLRPPSPKLAFSNGVRVSRHTRNRSMPSQLSAPIDLPIFGAKSSNPSCSLNKAPLRNGPRNPKTSTAITPKLQNKPSLRTGKESYSKAQGIGFAEKNLGPDVPKLVVKLGSKEGSQIKDTKIVPLAVTDY